MQLPQDEKQQALKRLIENARDSLTIMWRRLSYACINIILTILACSRRCFSIA
jgi:hypothetical protein